MPTRRPFRKLDYSYNHLENAQNEYAVKKIFDRAYTKSLKFLSFRPRSEKEIRDFLRKKEFDTEIIDKVIDLLISQKFLNDQEFTEWWTRGRQSGSAKSKAVIKQELKNKGIKEDMIENTFEDAQEDFETAKKYFEKRKYRYEGLPKEEYFSKAAGLLQRRGFSWEVVKKVLNDYE